MTATLDDVTDATRVHGFHLTARLERLAADSRHRGATAPAWRRHEREAYAYNELYADLPLRLRQARSLAYALTHEPVQVFADESIHGIFHQKHVAPETLAYARPKDIPGPRAQQVQFEAIPGLREILGADQPGGQCGDIVTDHAVPGHVAWNWDVILAIGAEGLIARHRAALDRACDGTAREFHTGVIICLEAMLEWNRAHIEALRRLLADEGDPARRRRLETSIAVMEQVPAHPARTFHEAVQSYHFQWTCVLYEAPDGGNSPGRMDALLWPFLREEYERGETDGQAATELLAELFLKCDERMYTHDGSNHTIVVGGIGPDGADAVNPLTYMILDAIEALNITHPGVYTRVHPVNGPEYLRRAVDYLLHGHNRGQILNDEAIIAAMTRDGRMPFADAARYICGGCMEINPQGLNSDMIWSFRYNLPKVLELSLTGGDDLITGRRRLELPRSLADFSTFEDFYGYVLGNVRRTLLAKFQALDLFSAELARHRPLFLLSSMMDDCLERGREQQDGGARYHDYGGSILGIPNVADALYAVQRAVFEERFCTAETLIAAIRADFAGHEFLRRRLAALPKYGQGRREVDALMNRLLTDICGILSSYTNRLGGTVKLVLLTYVFAPHLGAMVGALPDGRRSGTPLAHGLTPQSDAQTAGITAAIGSYASLDNRLVSGGASTMWDMDPSWISADLLEAIVRGFLAQGGQIFQGNMTAVSELLEAQQHPERYHHLIVRVGGFSARFVNLSRCEQDDVIRRCRHRGV